ncbi:MULTISPECIES: pyridoxal phosphate-dependent aminotransferase [unclassified Haladaptatus]|uniref:pyridoxal phosphate-dependent aminotransferase n=1 Tax=unclassified Haladaptatus TaxID=2622732 RepID=UPI0023E86D88|nr:MULTISPECIES: pyridoxal phosphate-dependent aminotransferase [unclassified Haladaptatus]
MDYEEPLFFRVMQYAGNADRDVIDMVSGNPDWGAPPAISDGLHEYADLGGEAFQYPPSDGMVALREEIAKRQSVAAERVVIANGGGEANYLAMAGALEQATGNEVILTDPVYPYYPGKTQMLGGTPRYVPVAEDGTLEPDAVRAIASEETALIMVNTPNNPTGAVYDHDIMAELVAIAEEHDAFLVSDEVYDEFDHSGTFTSALSFESDNCIITKSFSKSFAITGFRVGYSIFPDELVAAARTRHMLVNVTSPHPSQYAVLRALKETPESYHEETRELLGERIETFTAALDEAGATYTRPAGGFYVMARFDGFPGTLDNVFRLIDEAGVAGMPGEAFGEERSDWLRFALVTPRATEAATRLADFF